MVKILVIEDEPTVLANLARVLRLEGYFVLTAENGVADVAVAQAERPDLILCDLRMPELDGYGVLETLKLNPATAAIPIVFLTASADQSHRAATIARGAAGFMTKPFDLKELLALVGNSLPLTG